MNMAILMGRLTKDPEIRYTSGEKQTPIARFSLAVPKNGKSDESDFFEISAFGKNAEFAEKYLKKGGKYLFTTHAVRNDYTDKNGVKHYNNVNFVVDHIEFCTPASGGTTNTSSPVPAPVSAPAEPVEEPEVQQDLWNGDLGSDLNIY